jgi:hypothetical protein
MSAALAVGAQAAPALTLVRDEQPAAVIVLADNPSPAAVAGAQLLGDMLFQMSGARLKVVREGQLTGAKVEQGRVEATGDGAAAAYVLVGEGELARRLGLTAEGLGAGGIRIKTLANVLALLGPDGKTPSDPWGTRYAVTTLLDETLGCKYLWPTETGLVVPARKTVEVPALDVRFTPLLRQRMIRPMGYNDRLQAGLDKLSFTKEDYLKYHKAAAPEWFGWHRMGGTLGLIGGDGSILPKEAWERFQKEHPEWFAMQSDGSRDPAPNEGRPRLCKSNPALVEAIVQEKLKELKANPGRSSVSLMTHDGGQTGMCLCPACKAMDPQEGRAVKIWTYNHAAKKIEWIDYVSLTDRMFTFYNAIAEKVAKEYPEVLFTGQAYSVYSAPPVRTKLHPSIIIRYVGISYATDKSRKEGLDDWNTWSKAASKLYFRPNLLLLGRREGTPAIYVHKLAADFRHLAGHGMLGTDFDSCAHNWATQGLNYYILAKLHWNPDLDVDAAIDDYCRAGFGAGWQEARKYLARIEQLTDKMAAAELTITAPYTPEVIAELRGHLDAADKAAAGDEAVRRRVAFLRTGLDYAEMQAKVYRIVEGAKDRALTDEEKALSSALLDQRWRMMRKMFKEEPFAVNLAYVCWGERLAPVVWRGPSAKVKAEVEADEVGRPVEAPK